jgi:hypothetical protein
MKSSILRLALIGGAALAVTGCTTDGYGGYGYSSLSYGYGDPYYGWYEDYYYPGTGYYVYERSGARHRWSDSQRRYWQSHGGGRHHDNWSGYHRDGDGDRHDGHRWSGHHRSGGHERHGSSSGHRSGGHERHDSGGGHHSGHHSGNGSGGSSSGDGSHRHHR